MAKINWSFTPSYYTISYIIFSIYALVMVVFQDLLTKLPTAADKSS